MRSRTTAKFRKALARLPASVRAQARQSYRLFQVNPAHPSLRFKPVHTKLPIYSARIGKSYRAVGRVDGDTVIWFWVGTHADYDKLLTQL